MNSECKRKESLRELSGIFFFFSPFLKLKPSLQNRNDLDLCSKGHSYPYKDPERTGDWLIGYDVNHEKYFII